MNRFLLYVILLGLVAARYVGSRPVYKNGQLVRVTGTVLSEPVRYERSQGIAIAGLQAYVDPFPEVSYGDRVVVEGKVTDGKLANAEIVEVAPSGNALFGPRKKILGFYGSSLPEPHGALVSGIVLGSKEGVTGEFREALIKSGTIHVVVASGMNVTMLGKFIMATLVGFINRRSAVVFSIIAIWLYTLLSGLDAPLVRAAVMGSIAFGAEALGRLSSAIHSLLISAAVMLLLVPGWIGDLGFIMSFLATFALIAFQPLVNRKIQFVPSIIREDLSTTIAAQIGVAPILIGVFGGFNLLSPFINALVLWTVPLIMIIGSFSGVAGVFVPQIGILILFLLFPLTSWFISIVNLF